MSRPADRAICYACEVGGVTREQLLSSDRSYPLPVLRFICFDYLRTFYDMGSAAIGAVFNRNHATVLSGIKRLRDLLTVSYADVYYYFDEFYKLNNKDYGAKGCK